MSYSVAIDGPAGSGKSTIAKALAKELGLTYLDTGAMYRAVALKAIGQGIDPKSREEVPKLLQSTKIDIENQDDGQHILLDGLDVSGEIRTQEVSQGASDVGTIPEVRVFLVALQQQIAKGKSSIMDGRDIGTHVLPDAKFKFYLTANLEERTRRRQLELLDKGEEADFKTLKKEVEHRDYVDSHREFAPLKRAPDSILVDTTHMNIDEVIAHIRGIIAGERA